MKLILVGRSGAGKTTVMESILGSTLPQDQREIVRKREPPVHVKETLGFFSQRHDLHTCTQSLAESVRNFDPGPDAFGIVIRIGRFTAEEKKLIDNFRSTYGEDAFRFTILIFTRLDDLLEDGLDLDEFLQDSTPDLRGVIEACGGRYVGIDNTGSWEARQKYALTLLSMVKTLQSQNRNAVYSVDMLEKAVQERRTKEEEDDNRRKEIEKLRRDEMKDAMRQEMRAKMERERSEQMTTELVLRRGGNVAGKYLFVY